MIPEIKCLGVVDFRKGIQSIQKVFSESEMNFHRESLEFRTRTNNHAKIFTVSLPLMAYREIKDLMQEDPKMAETIISKFPSFITA